MEELLWLWVCPVHAVVNVVMGASFSQPALWDNHCSAVPWQHIVLSGTVHLIVVDVAHLVISSYIIYLLVTVLCI